MSKPKSRPSAKSGPLSPKAPGPSLQTEQVEEMERLRQKAAKVDDADEMNFKLKSELAKRDEKIKDLQQRMASFKSDIDATRTTNEIQDRRIEVLKASIAQVTETLNNPSKATAKEPHRQSNESTISCLPEPDSATSLTPKQKKQGKGNFLSAAAQKVTRRLSMLAPTASTLGKQKSTSGAKNPPASKLAPVVEPDSSGGTVSKQGSFRAFDFGGQVQPSPSNSGGNLALPGDSKIQNAKRGSFMHRGLTAVKKIVSSANYKSN